MPRFLLPLMASCIAAFPACSHPAPTKDTAVETCTSALAASADQADSTVAGRSVAVACAPIFEERACRDGWLRAWDEQTDPAERTRIMVDACSAAYCPKLPDPKPALCAQPSATAPGGFAGLAQRWQEFQRVVLARDLGAARAERVLAAMRRSAAKRAAKSGR